MTMRVEGPLAYLDEWTTDGRLLRADGFVPPDCDVPIIAIEKHAVVGLVDNVEVWGNLLWAYGECERVGRYAVVSIGVSPLGSSVSDGNKLSFDRWSLREIVVGIPGAWSDRTFLANVVDPMYK